MKISNIGIIAYDKKRPIANAIEGLIRDKAFAQVNFF